MMLRWADVVGPPEVALERGARDQWPTLTVAVFAAVAAGLVMGQFGVPPLNLHPPTHYLGLMDPACGMTRASAALGRGDLVVAWRYNPGVFAVAAGAGAMILRVAVAVVTGSWWRIRVDGWPFWLVVAAGLAALEVNQQLHADLLRG